jgi:oxygen-dependent protoporphyrinogen oxidase
MPVQYSLARALDRHNISGSLLLTGIRSLLRGGSDVPIVSFTDGLQTLPRALYERNADRISLESPVSDLRIIDDEVELSTGSRSARFDAVALTTPAETASELLAECDPETADALAGLTYNPLAVVHLLADADLTGAGYQVPRDEPYETLGVTWNASLLGRNGVYTCYLGGSKHPGLVEHGVDELGEIAATEFEAVTGVAADPIHVHRVLPGMPAYDHSWDNFDRISPPADVHLCANYTDRAGIPGRIDAAERLADQLAASTPASSESMVTGGPTPGH